MAKTRQDRAWLALAADPVNAVGFFTAPDAKPAYEVSGDYREMANGRVRLVRPPGRKVEHTVTAMLLPPDAVQLVKDWAGQMVLYRDHRGRLLYGSYLKLEFGVYVDSPAQDVTFTLRQLSYVEGV